MQEAGPEEDWEGDGLCRSDDVQTKEPNDEGEDLSGGDKRTYKMTTNNDLKAREYLENVASYIGLGSLNPKLISPDLRVENGCQARADTVPHHRPSNPVNLELAQLHCQAFCSESYLSWKVQKAKILIHLLKRQL